MNPVGEGKHGGDKSGLSLVGVRAAAAIARATRVILLLKFGSGEFAHIHGDIVLLENFASEQVFHHVFHRNDASSGAEFIDDDEQLLVGFKKNLQGISGSDCFGYEADFLHELLD
jgi:hypothetical protein